MIRVDVAALEKSAMRLRREVGAALNGLAFRAAAHVAEEATVRTPVDTGRLKGNWSAVERGPLSAEVRNPVHYASFVEFDTRHWISGNIVPGQRFLARAVEETEEALPDMVEERLREVIERCFGD